MECPAFIPTKSDAQIISENFADTVIPYHQMFTFNLTGQATPSQPKQVFLKQFGNLTGKQIKGFNFSASNADLSAYGIGGTFTVLTQDLLSRITFSFWDIRKKTYSIINMPLAFACTSFYNSFVSSAKVPYLLCDLVPDMNKSYFTINTASGFVGTNYILLGNFFYIP